METGPHLAVPDVSHDSAEASHMRREHARATAIRTADLLSVERSIFAGLSLVVQLCLPVYLIYRKPSTSFDFLSGFWFPRSMGCDHIWSWACGRSSTLSQHALHDPFRSTVAHNQGRHGRCLDHPDPCHSSLSRLSGGSTRCRYRVNKR